LAVTKWQMEKRRSDETTKASSWIFADEIPRVDVQLDMMLDADIAAEYLTDVTGFRMNEDVVEITDVEEDACTAVVSCRSMSQAKELVSAINLTTVETRLTARLHEVPEFQLEIERMWKWLCNEAQARMQRHLAKVDEVQSELEQIGARNRKGRGVEIGEYFRQQDLRRPLQDKLVELQSQQEEFCGFMDGVQARLESWSGLQDVAEDLEPIRAEFELECGRFERALPVYGRRTDILEAISSNQVVVLLGETGSGKSTQIVQYAYAAGFHERGTVVCTQPRKVAALSLARRVGQEMGNVPMLVGSRVGAQYRATRDAKLLYVTDHILLNDCLKDPLFSKYSLILVDEAHERSIFSDLLLGFIKLALPRRCNLRVVIMSATINPDLFVSYFSDWTGRKPPVLRVSGCAFPVEVCHEESSDDYTTAAYLKALEVHRTEPPGDILVFLTSPLETEKACRNLLSHRDADSSTIQVLELHGRLQIEDQQKVGL